MRYWTSAETIILLVTARIFHLVFELHSYIVFGMPLAAELV